MEKRFEKFDDDWRDLSALDDRENEVLKFCAFAKEEARRESVEFLKWLMKNIYWFAVDGSLYQFGEPNVRFTPEQVYDLYLKEKK